MKTCLFVMLCSFSTLALAQSASATANVTANMTTMLTVTRNSDLTFGTVTQGATSSDCFQFVECCGVYGLWRGKHVDYRSSLAIRLRSKTVRTR